MFPDWRDRFFASEKSILGISQKMLTATLRNLEREGLVSCRPWPTNPNSTGSKPVLSHPVAPQYRQYGHERRTDEQAQQAKGLGAAEDAEQYQQEGQAG